MKIISWNVNGIRAVLKKGFLDWLSATHPEILCVQETKAYPNQLPDELLHPDGYHTYWHMGEKKGYSGVAIFSKKEPLRIQTEFDSTYLSTEGRTLLAEYHDFILINSYCPNGKRSEERLAHKMHYYEDLLALLQKYTKQGKHVLLTGDINTAHKEIDLARPKENEKISGFLPQERAWIDRLLEAGFIDTFREFHREGEQYSWWDMKSHARDRNVGWRIDYFFASSNIKKHLQDAFILSDVVGSDHCPVGIDITF